MYSVRATLPFLAFAVPAARIVLGGSVGPGLIPVLQQTGLAELLWALVNNAGTLLDGRGATAATRLGTGSFRVTFNRPVNTCVSIGSMTDATGGAVPNGALNRMVSTDNRVQGDNTTVDIATTDSTGADADPAGGDGFALTVYC